LGAFLTRWISGSFLVALTEVVLLALGVRFMLRPNDPREVAAEPSAYRLRLAIVAASVGLASGLLANAGGFLLAPLFITVLRLPIKEAFASSLAVAAVFALPGTAVHAALGHIDWTIVAVMGVTSIPLSYVGARVALRTQAVWLERVYGGVLALIGGVFLLTGH
jgi:hypothetical protein